MKNLNLGEQNLKSRLTEHEFDFDPQAWKSLNKQLNNHNPRRSPLWVLSLALLTMTVTLLSVAWYAPAELEPIKEFIEQVISLEEKEDTREIHIIRPRTKMKVKELKIESVVPETKERKQRRKEVEKTIGPPELIDIEWQRTEVKSSKPIASVESLLEEKATERIEPVGLPMPKRKVEAGFFGGGSVALSDSPLTPHGALSPSIGVFAGYKINDKWSVQAEVNLKKGFIDLDPKNEIVDVLPSSANARSAYERLQASPEVVAKNLTVLEFPILAKYKVNEKNSVMAGVRPSWIQVKDPNSDNNTIAADAANTMFKKVDVGLSIGYERQISERVALNIRYNKGVTNLFNESETDNKYYNTDFQASVRYTLNP